MIKEVYFDKTTYNDLPYKYERVRRISVDTVAFKSAIDFVNRWGKARIRKHEEDLLKYVTESLSEIKGSKNYWPGEE